MDRNSAIGLTLIAALLLVYFNFLAPTPQPETAQPAQVTTTDGAVANDSLAVNAVVDSARMLQYGSLSSFTAGNEEETKIENNNLLITLSNKGYIKEIQLKDFKTYQQQPLYLAKDGNNTFSLIANYEGKDIDLYKLYYRVETSKKSDTTLITLSASTGANSFIKHVYSIPPTGYQIGYEIQANGISYGSMQTCLQA